MADIRIKDLTTTASTTAADDFFAADGTTNGTRKLSAYSPTFGGNATVSGSLTVSGTTTADGLATSGFFGGSKRVIAGYNTSSDYGFIASVDTGVGWKELHLNPVGGVVKVPNTAASTTTSSGALVVSGGIGVAGAINAGGAVNAQGILSTSNAAGVAVVGGRQWSIRANASGGSPPSAFVIRDDSLGSERVTIDASGNIAALSTTASTGTSSGALVVSGGVGVAGAIYAGGGLAVTGGSAAAGSIFKTSTLGLVMSGATGSSYDLFLTNPAGNYIMQVPTGTRNVEFAATLTTIGNITSGAAIATSAPAGGSGSWELGVYSTTAPAATGYVTIEIGGVAYKLLASNV